MGRRYLNKGFGAIFNICQMGRPEPARARRQAGSRGAEAEEVIKSKAGWVTQRSRLVED